mgnify:CR=1 FL=1
MRTLFSPASAFRAGQTVTAAGLTGVAIGYRRGRTGKTVLVKITGTKGGKRGRLIAFAPAQIVARRGKDGTGPLLRAA